MQVVTTRIHSKDSKPAGHGWLSGLGNAIVDLLFPPYCVACQRYGAWMCAQCEQEIEIIRPPFCHRCGLPLDDTPARPSAQTEHATSFKSPLSTQNIHLCRQCRTNPPQLDGLRAYAFHSGPLREAIHQFKYQDLRSLATPLGRMMGEGWSDQFPMGQDVDVIVPIPLHSTRLRARGYNQAALLAVELGAHLGRPVVENVLVRTRATAPQVDLNPKERKDNVRDAFRTVNERLAGMRVLLVDDVCTTGSTLNAACTALRQGGVSSVWAYALARAKSETETISR